MLLSYTVGAHDAADERGEFNENPRCHCGFSERENELNVVFSCFLQKCASDGSIAFGNGRM